MNIKPTLLAAIVCALVLGGCNDGSPLIVPDTGTDPTRRLKTLDNGEAFFAELRRALARQSVSYGVGDSDVSAPESPQAGGDGLSSNTEGSDDSGAQRNEVTSTNVQELGVDEQDRVKIKQDGTRLFVLQSGYPDIYYINDVAIGASVASPDFAPQASTTTLRILGLDAAAPDATALKDVEIDLGGRYADGFYLYEKNECDIDTELLCDTALLISTGGGYWGYWAESLAFSGLESVITRVDVTDPVTAAVSGTFRIDGQIVSSRRIGKYLFFVSRYYPAIPGVQPWQQTPEQWQDTVDNADLASLLPRYTADDSSTIKSLVDPAGCFVAAKPQGNDYYSPDIITLGVIDLDTMQLSDSECYLGATETLYASTEAVYLATTQYQYFGGPITTDGQVIDVERGEFPVDVIWSDPRVDTDVHKFDITSSGKLDYIGSGSVRGHLGWNALRKPFRMSEKDGVLRIATMSDRQASDVSPIHVSVLEPDGNGNLQRIAELPNAAFPDHIGKPGEQLYASRFAGDRAYLVTFRQTDPLYVIDLANPREPRIAGLLEIDGYSDYLQPIDSNYLLGIGKDAVAAPDGWGTGQGAIAQGVKLSLFNVTNPAEPTEVQSLVVGQRGTESQALYNHRAITVQAATEQHPTRISFGIDVHGLTSPGAPPRPEDAWNSYNWSYTGLHAFDVSVGDGADIIPRGALVVERSDGSGYRYGPNSNEDRSVMVNDSVFYIHGRDVYAAPWDNLGNPTAAR